MAELVVSESNLLFKVVFVLSSTRNHFLLKEVYSSFQALQALARNYWQIQRLEQPLEFLVSSLCGCVGYAGFLLVFSQVGF